MFAPSVVMPPMLAPNTVCVLALTRSDPPESADHLLDHFDELGRVEGLDQPAGGAGTAPGLLHLVARLGGQDQDRRALELGVVTQLAGQPDAVQARHVLV